MAAEGEKIRDMRVPNPQFHRFLLLSDMSPSQFSIPITLLLSSTETVPAI
jgi:hypothetical protein